MVRHAPSHALNTKNTGNATKSKNTGLSGSSEQKKDKFLAELKDIYITR